MRRCVAAPFSNSSVMQDPSSRTLLAQGRTPQSKGILRNRPRRAQSHLALLVEEITSERHAYEVELAGSGKCDGAWRLGSEWFDSDGEHVADSVDIVAIRVPARRS